MSRSAPRVRAPRTRAARSIEQGQKRAAFAALFARIDVSRRPSNAAVLLLRRERCELLVELLDAAGRVHDLLLTGVERMRFRRHFDLRERIGLAFELGGFSRVDGRTRHE